MLEAIPQAQLIILGSGVNQIDSVEEHLRTEVKTKKIKNITFIGNSNTPERFLGLSDIFVFTSLKEGCPNVVLEAMASGLSIISTQITGTKKFIIDGKTGLLFPVGDAKILAQKIIYLINEKDKRIELGRQARQHVLNNFSFEIIANKYVDIYNKLLNKI